MAGADSCGGYETAAVRDVRLAEAALTAFFDADLRIDGADAFELG